MGKKNNNKIEEKVTKLKDNIDDGAGAAAGASTDQRDGVGEGAAQDVANLPELHPRHVRVQDLHLHRLVLPAPLVVNDVHWRAQRDEEEEDGEKEEEGEEGREHQVSEEPTRLCETNFSSVFK